MLRIRLSRKGKKRQPSYRVVVADVNYKRDGRFVENIGWYNPLTNPQSFNIDEGRALYWLSVGAQPSDAVKRLLKNQGTYDRLPRVHGGETIETIVAELEGRPVEKDEKPKAAKGKKSETAEDVASGGMVETVREAVASTAETVENVVGSVVEAAGDAVEAVVEAITGDEAENAAVADNESDEEEEA